MQVNYEISRSIIFREKKIIFFDREVGGGTASICSRPEADGDIISSHDVDTFWVLSFCEFVSC